MKRPIALSSVAALFLYLSLSSYSSGPAKGVPSLGNRTGTGNVIASCSGNGCHGGIDPNIIVYFKFEDIFLGTVTNGIYKPGKKYRILLEFKNPTNPVTKFGFQLTAVKETGKVDVGNTIIAPANTHLQAVDNVTVLEHDIPLGSNGHLFVQFDWTAPPAGTGKISFNMIVNAVDGDGQADADDKTILLKWEYNEGPASVNEFSEDIRITAYPNPASDHLSLRFDNATKGDYTIQVFDFTGRRVCEGDVSITNANASIIFPSSSWVPGLYMVQIIKDGAQRLIPVSKQ